MYYVTRLGDKMEYGERHTDVRTTHAEPAGMGELKRLLEAYAERQHGRQQLLRQVGYTLHQAERDKQRVLADTRRILGR